MSLSAPCTTRSRIAGIDRTRTLPPSFGISCRLAAERYVGTLDQLLPYLLKKRLFALRSQWPRMSLHQYPELHGSSWPAHTLRVVSPSCRRGRTTPETPGRFSLRLDVYPSPQVLQPTGRLCHLVLASRVVEVITIQQGPFTPQALPGFSASTDPSATLSPSAHFRVRRL